MTTINNYDNCSTKSDCELTCFLDTDISRMDWEETFKEIPAESPTCEQNVWFFTGFGEDPEPPELVTQCLDTDSVSEKEAKSFLLKYIGQKTYQNLRYLVEDKQSQGITWKEVVLNIMAEEFYLADCLNKQEFPDFGMPLYEFVEINGYCQGDYACIMYKTQAADFNALLKEREEMKKHFTNLFYDAPAYCRLMVDGEEYELTEGLNDIYQWEPDEIITYAKENLKLGDDVLAWLSEKLPAQLVA